MTAVVAILIKCSIISLLLRVDRTLLNKSHIKKKTIQKQAIKKISKILTATNMTYVTQKSTALLLSLILIEFCKEKKKLGKNVYSITACFK